MKISYNWLQNYLDLSTTSVEAIAEMLPLLGFDVESIERLGPPQLEHVVVGKSSSMRSIPMPIVCAAVK